MARMIDAKSLKEELNGNFTDIYYDRLLVDVVTTIEEHILDKIRAEVEKKIIKRPWLDFKDMERDRNDAFLEVLDIIDKYKTESGKGVEECLQN